MIGLRFALPAVLLAVFQLLFLYRYNFSEVDGESLPVLPLVLCVVVPLSIYFGLSKWIIAETRRSVCSSIIVAFLFYFGAFADLAELWGVRIPVSLMAVAWSAFWLSVLVRVLRNRTSVKVLHQLTLYFGLFVVGIECVDIGSEYVSVSTIPVEPIRLTDARPVKDRPDIYHIVLDGYAGSQTLMEKFSDDNRAFLQDLQSKGFVVSTRSSANYPSTFLSLASMLNIDYLQRLGIPTPPHSKDRKALIELIRANRVSKYLREKGYEVIHFKTNWAGTSDNPYATHTIDCYNDISGPGGIRSSLSLLWQQSTILRAFSGHLFEFSVVGPTVDAFNCMFARLESSASLPGPKYVFAHIMLPHPPYVFDEEGNPLERSTSSVRNWRPELEYWGQLKYLNKRVSRIVDGILRMPGHDPIIILNSDHGPAFSGNEYSDEMIEERFRILMAVRLPRDTDSFVYEGITPVNVFRLIFNRFVDGQFALLPDDSYFTDTDESFFDYREITAEIHFN